MSIAKHDRVMFRGKVAKVVAHPAADGRLRLHVGSGQVLEDVPQEDVDEIPAEPAPAPKPVAVKAKAKPQGTAPRQRSKSGGRSS